MVQGTSASPEVSAALVWLFAALCTSGCGEAGMDPTPDDASSTVAAPVERAASAASTPDVVEEAPEVAEDTLAEAEPAEPWNLVLITADTLRADHLGCYGYFRDTSPKIDRVAEESLLFEQCISPIPRTTPSHLSLMTGIYPIEHGIVKNTARSPAAIQEKAAFHAGPRLETVAQALSDKGYDTGGFVSAAPVKKITGLATGFAHWDEPKGRRSGVNTNKRAGRWLSEAREPFFMWVHYMDAHGPFEVGKSTATRRFDTDEHLRAHQKERGIGPPSDFSINEYDAAITLLDDATGELIAGLEEKGVWDRTMFVFMSDHGQGLGQHGFFGHETVWGEQLQIPLLLRYPGVEPGRDDRLMCLIDTLPTVLARMPGLSDLEFFEQCRGVDALATDFEPRPIFGMSVRLEKAFSWTTPEWKYIQRRNGDNALYDRANDPHELDNLIDGHPEIAARLDAELLASIEEQRARARQLQPDGDEARDELDASQAEHLEQLRALGYTGDDE
jgi:arylsulfatase